MKSRPENYATPEQNVESPAGPNIFEQIVAFDFLPPVDLQQEITTDNNFSHLFSSEGEENVERRHASKPAIAENQQTSVGNSPRMYRIDDQHDRFQPSRLLSQSNLHLTIKALPVAEPIEIDQLVRHNNAMKISRGSALQQIVVSTYETFDCPASLSELPVDSIMDLEAVGLPVDFSPYGGSVSVSEVTPEIKSRSEAAGHGVNGLLDQGGKTNTEKVIEDSGICENNVDAAVEKMESDIPQPIKPAWEVAAFRWPKTIQKLSTDHRNSFLRLLESIQEQKSRKPSRLGVLHAVNGQGATTLAACLAKILAEGDSKVLLADMDIEHPCLEGVANIQLNKGWQDLIASDEPIGEFMVRDAAQRLTLMPLVPSGNLVSKREELLNRMRAVTREITEQFDYSIFDIGNAHNLMVEENCHVDFLDAVIIVSDSSREKSTAVSIYDKLVAAGVPSVVIAENFRNPTRTAA